MILLLMELHWIICGLPVVVQFSAKSDRCKLKLLQDVHMA